MDRRLCDKCGVSSEVRPVTRWLPSVKGGLVFDLCSECEAGLRGMLLARIEHGMTPEADVPPMQLSKTAPRKSRKAGVVKGEQDLGQKLELPAGG